MADLLRRRRGLLAGRGAIQAAPCRDQRRRLRKPDEHPRMLVRTPSRRPVRPDPGSL